MASVAPLQKRLLQIWVYTMGDEYHEDQSGKPTCMSISCVSFVKGTVLSVAPVAWQAICQGTRLLWCSATETMTCKATD